MSKLELELVLVVRNPETGQRYSLLERRLAEVYEDDRYEALLDMVTGMVIRPITQKMLEVERGTK